MFWFAAGVSVLRKSCDSDGMLGNLGIQIEQADVAKKLQARWRSMAENRCNKTESNKETSQNGNDLH